MDESLYEHLKDSLEADTPPAVDMRIRAAIRRSRPRRVSRWKWWAAAAGVALALGCGTWLYNREHAQQLAAMRDAGEVMLEIMCMASVDDVYNIDTMQL